MATIEHPAKTAAVASIKADLEASRFYDDNYMHDIDNMNPRVRARLKKEHNAILSRRDQQSKIATKYANEMTEAEWNEKVAAGTDILREDFATSPDTVMQRQNDDNSGNSVHGKKNDINTAQFEIGDKVDFVNDYGAAFPNKTVTGIVVVDGEIRYDIVPTDTPWYPDQEKHLLPHLKTKELLEFGEFTNAMHKNYFHKDNSDLKKLCQLAYDLNLTFQEQSRKELPENNLSIKMQDIALKVRDIVKQNYTNAEEHYSNTEVQFIYDYEANKATIKLMLPNKLCNDAEGKGFVVPAIAALKTQNLNLISNDSKVQNRKRGMSI